MPACTWPDRIAVVAGAVPLNGTFWIESPARALSSSPARWPWLPTPEMLKLSCPGRSLA